MKKGMKLCLVLLAACLTTSAAYSATVEEKAPGNAFRGAQGKYRKALVVVWDGARGDVAVKPEIAPNLNTLAKEGAASFTAFTGGFPGDPRTKTSTVTACGFMNTFTGVFADKHKITGNNAKNPNWKEYPSFFNRIKTASAGKAYIAGFFGWKPTWKNWISEENTQYDVAIGVDDVDVSHFDRIVDLLANNTKLDLFFLETGEPDHAGHSSGFSAESPNYVKAIQTLDSKLALLINAIKSRKTYKIESWLIIVTTDHGGKNKGHGGQSPEERTIFVVATSPDIKAGTTIADPVSHIDVYPTLMKHFGIKVKPDWKLEGKSIY